MFKENPMKDTLHFLHLIEIVLHDFKTEITISTQIKFF